MRLWFPNARAVSAMALLGLLCLTALPAVAQEARSEIAVDGKFDGKKGGQATDLSGIACRPEDDSGYTCVVVNDESPFAQFATLRNGRRLPASKSIFSPVVDGAWPTKPRQAACSAPRRRAGLSSRKGAPTERLRAILMNSMARASPGCPQDPAAFSMSSDLTPVAAPAAPGGAPRICSPGSRLTEPDRYRASRN
jgi:hypothetical protein